MALSNGSYWVGVSATGSISILGQLVAFGRPLLLGGFEDDVAVAAFANGVAR
jgi:hypothetical protein